MTNKCNERETNKNKGGKVMCMNENLIYQGTSMHQKEGQREKN